MSVAAEQLPAERNVGGRPSEYSLELADRICEMAAEGNSIQKVARRFELAPRTIFRWCRENETFRQMYAQARKDAAYVLAEETLDIADDSSRDYVEDPETGRRVFQPEHVQRARLRWDARRWLASKYLPKVFGDKVDVEHSGSVDTGTRLDANGVIDGLVALANEQPITREPLRRLLEEALRRLPAPALEHK